MKKWLSLLCLVWCWHLLPWWRQLRADYALGSEHHDQAQKILNDTLIDNPHDAVAAYNAGQLAYQRGEFQSAQAYFEAVGNQLDAVPSLRMQGWYQAGNSSAQQEQWEQSLADFKKVLEFDPNHEYAKRMIEQIEKLLKQKEEEKQQESDAQQNPEERQQEDKQQKDQQKDEQNESQSGQSEDQREEKSDSSDAHDGSRDEQQKKGDQKQDNHGNKDTSERDQKQGENKQQQPGTSQPGQNGNQQEKSDKDKDQQENDASNRSEQAKNDPQQQQGNQPSEKKSQKQEQKPSQAVADNKKDQENGGKHDNKQSKGAERNKNNGNNAVPLSAQQGQQATGADKQGDAKSSELDRQGLLLQFAQEADGQVAKMLMMQQMRANQGGSYGQKNW